MSNGGSRDVVYAAAEGREFLRDELEGKSNEWVNEFAGLVESRATLDLLNHYCSVWREARERGRLPTEMPDRFLDTATAKTILTSASTVSMDDAFNSGNVSKLKGVVGVTGNQTTEALDWQSHVVTRLANEGTVGLLLGPPGAGKTSLALDLARQWGSTTGGALVGNTEWGGFDDVVTSDTQLFEAMGSRSGPVLAVIDETAQELSGFGSANKAAEVFSDNLTFIRKREDAHGPHAKKGSVLMVNHTMTKTAKAFRDLCSFAVEKPHNDKQNFARLIDSEGGVDVADYTDADVVAETNKLTDTRESFSEHEASEFHITNADADDGDTDDGPSPDDVRGAEQKRNVLLTLAQSDASYGDVAAMPWCDATKSTVGRWWRSWRDNGEFTDLVPELNPDDYDAE